MILGVYFYFLSAFVLGRGRDHAFVGAWVMDRGVWTGVYYRCGWWDRLDWLMGGFFMMAGWGKKD